MKHYFTSALVLCLSVLTLAQKTTNNNFVRSEDILGTRVFIENKGQFENPLDKSEKVLFKYDHRDERIYFTTKGLIYEMVDKFSISEEEREAFEHGQPGEMPEPAKHYVRMSWPNSFEFKYVEAADKQSHYFTYGTPDLNSSTYKKITYLNVYPNIDVEFVIPKDKNAGVKYNVIVHPGADYEKFKIEYSGDVKKIKLLSNGDVSIKTSVENIIEHAPASFDQNKNDLPSEFVLENNVLSFKVNNNNPTKGFTIDPWVTAITTLSNNNYGYDVDYDFAGNTFVYGGNGATVSSGKFKVAKYSTAGVLLWTFSGIVTANAWQSGNNWSCNFKVNKGTGKTYVGRNNAIPYLIRLDANGNYDNFVSASGSPNVQEVWNMEFNCSGDIQIFGGGGSSGGIISSTTGAVSNVTTFSPGVTGCCQDVVAVAVDAVGNTFVTYLGHPTLQNKIALIAPSYTNSVWLSPTNFSSLTYLAVKNGYVASGVGAAVAFNALAVNMNYIYYYDGSHLGAYNKSNGNMISSITNSLTAGQQGGVAVDDCDNIYVGGNGSILAYHFNGTTFSTLTPIALNTSTTIAYNYVYDVQINKMTQQLFVTGSGFVGTYAAAYSSTCGLANVQNPCNFGQFALVASTNSINCANLLGSATVTPIGGVGPFTYTWLPSGQNGSVSTGLGPGNYTVVSYDSGANYSFTSNITFTPSVPLTANVISTGILNCFGLTNGTAAIANIVGGSGSQTYSWTIGSNTYTTPTVSNLSLGNYTVTITDALTFCAYTETFSILQPQQLGVMMFANNPTVCAGQSTTLTAIGSGGSPGYTFAWNGGPTTDTYVVNSSTAGIVNYSISTQDSHGCLTNGVTSVTFVPNPTLTVSNPSICPLEIGTLSVTGASTYTWNNTYAGSTFSDNPTATQVYSVLGSAQSCTATATGSIVLKSVPIPTLLSNSPVCNGQNLSFTVLGGTGFVWTGPQSYSSLLQSNTISAASPNHNGAYNVTLTAANACTASAAITLSVHPTPSLSAFGSTVCSNQTFSLSAQSLPGSSYYWTGPSGYTSLSQNPTMANPPAYVSGNYTVRATSPQGCTNTAISNVTVTTLPNIFPSNNAPLCFGDNLHLNPNNTGGLNYFWSGPAGFSSQLQNPTINNVALAAGGVYTVTVTAGPCITAGTTSVLIHPLPSPVASNNGPVCESRPFNLSVSTPSNNTITAYVWQGPNNYVNYTSQGNIASSVLNQTGTYTIMVTDIYGCKNISTTSVSILNNPTVSAVGDTVCLYQAAELKANGGNSYQWFSNTGNFSALPIAIITKASNVAPTVYTVVGTAANSCTAAATCTLYTWALPQPSVTVYPNAAACINNTFNLEAQGSLYYSWTGPGNRLYNGQKLSLFANSMAYSGVYTLTGIDQHNCRTDVTTQITVYNLPEGSLSKGIREACVPFNSDYIYTPAFNSAALSSFSWELDGKTYSTTTISKTFTKPGTYILKGKMTDVNGCANTMTALINAWPQPVANFTYSPTLPVENGDEVIFNSTSTGINLTEWNWFFSPEINQKTGYTVNKEITSYLFKEAGNYPVALVVKTQNGCLDSVVKVIHVDEDFNVYVPTAFTPNGDKENDLFLPVTRGVKAYHFYVFDRWDEPMFESTDPNVGWNGTHKGKECKQDVYVWKLIITSKHDIQKVYTGEIILMK